MMAYWNPMPMLLVTYPPVMSEIGWYAPMLGYAIVLYASFNLDHFHLFGVKQAMGVEINDEFAFKTSGLYSIVRHPLMSGM
jgi:protein-S-isoprenylcysteine O-methyltransferase Ste14